MTLEIIRSYPGGAQWSTRLVTGEMKLDGFQFISERHGGGGTVVYPDKVVDVLLDGESRILTPKQPVLDDSDIVVNAR